MYLPKEFRVKDESASMNFCPAEMGIIDALNAMGARVAFSRRDGFVLGNYEDGVNAVLVASENHHMALLGLFSKYLEMKVKEHEHGKGI